MSRTSEKFVREHHVYWCEKIFFFFCFSVVFFFFIWYKSNSIKIKETHKKKWMEEEEAETEEIRQRQRRRMEYMERKFGKTVVCQTKLLNVLFLQKKKNLWDSFTICLLYFSCRLVLYSCYVMLTTEKK